MSVVFPALFFIFTVLVDVNTVTFPLVCLLKCISICLITSMLCLLSTVLMQSLWSRRRCTCSWRSPSLAMNTLSHRWRKSARCVGVFSLILLSLYRRLSTEPSDSSSVMFLFLVLFFVFSLDRNWTSARMWREPPSWQLAALRRSSLHPSLVCTQPRVHTHAYPWHSDVPRWFPPLLTPDWLLLPRRCLHHPRWRGGGYHRWLSGLQHPLHHRRVRDLCWTGVCNSSSINLFYTVQLCTLENYLLEWSSTSWFSFTHCKSV